MSATVNKIAMILSKEYSVGNYMDLMSEILDPLQIVAPNNPRKEYTNFSSHIESYTHVGNYASPDKKKIIVMAVELKNQTYVENSRSTQRSYAKKLMENASADAALIAFHTQGIGNWRLSFVRLDYEIKIENGKLNTAENLTPARRYSFLVGKDEPCHTAIERFRLFTHNNTTNPTLDEIESAFSVETVTKEFFELYCEKFLQLCDCLEKNNEFLEEARLHNFTSAQFAKKLMGQIVFLYFLQKKGWLGVKAWRSTLTEKEYKSAFFSKGSKSRALIPRVYLTGEDGLYHLSKRGLDELDNADEEILAGCVKGEPWGSGPYNFMRKLYDLAVKENANFFDDYLEPLFYNALNVNRGEQGYDPALHCRIPFLSGGLFEPIDGYDWKHNYFAIPNELFSNKKNDKDRLADGILDIFDRYNFTMSEDEPLEREVAIDPEMLGKVFENLLDVNDRKSKGAFYTPREIVHYMCQESLISYLTNVMQVKESTVRDFILYGDFMKDEDAGVLKRAEKGDTYELWISEELFELNTDGMIKTNRIQEMDKALQDVRVADPAVGSGAFPLGMLNEIVRARQNLTTYMDIVLKIIDPKGASREIRYRRINDRSTRQLKYDTIRNSIFAVDIEPSAVDIAQLRLWLALVIDDEIDPNALTALDGHRNPLPLPNLECNILCGNSLIDEFEGIRLINDSELIGNTSDGQMDIYRSGFNAMLERLIEKQQDLFRCDNTDTKARLLEEIADLRNSVIMTQLERVKPDTLKNFEATKNMASKPFILWQLDFAKVFREKSGFDIVIGNPPYVGEKGNKETFRPIAATNFGRRFYVGKMDLFYFFFHKAIDLGNANCEIAFITTNYYLTAFGAKTLRKDFYERTQMRRLINLNELKVFESALGQHNLMTFLTKKQNKQIYSINSICGLQGVADSSTLKKVLYTMDKKNQYSDVFFVLQDDLYDGDEYYIRLMGCGVSDTDSINSVLGKIANTKYYLKNVAEIKQGIVSGADKYTDSHQNMYQLDQPKGKGIFILTKNELVSLSLSETERQYVKPVYKNSQINKYAIDYDDNLYVLYITKETDINHIPNILLYLEQFKSIIGSKRETINGRLPWYSLNWPREKYIFDFSEKIVNSRRAKSNIFALETRNYYEQSDIMITVVKNEYVKVCPPKYLLGLLNSKLLYVWLKHRGKLKGDLFELYGKPLEEIPIKLADSTITQKIVTLVDSLVNNVVKNRNAVIDEIDRLVYELYGLSSVEIEIIEKIV